jgi:hypothetical protein
MRTIRGGSMSRYAILKAIRRLDPEKDDQRIIFLSTCYDFPFDTTRALELALFRTFGVPSISALLDRTGSSATGRSGATTTPTSSSAS